MKLKLPKIKKISGMRYHRVRELMHAVQGSRINIVHIILQSHILRPILYLCDI